MRCAGKVKSAVQLVNCNEFRESVIFRHDSGPVNRGPPQSRGFGL
jgi:hypothetical protein